MAVKLPIIDLGLQDQKARYDGGLWSIPLLIECSKDLPVFDYCLASADLSNGVDFGENMLDYAAHIRRVAKADLSYPIILHPDGAVLDGRHRLLKALVVGRDSIKAVRFTFEALPSPCSSYLV